jgi:hypothetical protein
MEWCWYDAIRIDGQKRSVGGIDGMFITRLAIARGFGEAIERDDADGAGMRGSTLVV